jgi:hypothetical protein
VLPSIINEYAKNMLFHCGERGKKMGHGQTLAGRMKPGLSFQHYKMSLAFHALTLKLPGPIWTKL